jgi:YesN/AraC family two-component response regulator
MAEGILLFVDVEEINLLLFKMSFSGHFNIMTTDSPLKALEMIKDNDIRVVITDYKMPNMNGMELILEIKKLKPKIICVILSGYFEAEVAIEKEMIYKYVMKPWDKIDLIKIVDSAFNLSGNLKPA